ncbi:hypothetical protein C0J52_14643 [Blattella germanica]|nr:hypothetical protein C0J52_14643 [Blattella germanica]
MRTNFGRFLQVPVDFRKKSSQSLKSTASVTSHFSSNTKGTVRPNPNLNAELAARELNAAFQGVKSDAISIINILTSHSNHQRQKIKRHYRIMYSKKIRPEEIILVELLCGRSNSRIRLIKESYHKRYGRELEIAVKREMNSDLRRLIRILLSTEREEGKAVDIAKAHKEAQLDLADIKDCYVEMYDTKLATIITEETRGDYRRILLRLLGY